jgi:hypothetical protein
MWQGLHGRLRLLRFGRFRERDRAECRCSRGGCAGEKEIAAVQARGFGVGMPFSGSDMDVHAVSFCDTCDAASAESTCFKQHDGKGRLLDGGK